VVRAEAHTTGRAHALGLSQSPLEASPTGAAARAGSRASADRFARHMIVFRHADSRFPFLWESAGQPPARWHGPGEGRVNTSRVTPAGRPPFPFPWGRRRPPPGRLAWPGEGPVQYFADTPDGAWAEFLRHEGITEESELVNVRRALWAIEVPDELPTDTPRLAPSVLTGGTATYEECQKEARRLRTKGTQALQAPSAALLPGGARGWKVDGGLEPAAERDGTVLAVFGPRSGFVGWMAAFAARPRSDLLSRVRYLYIPPRPQTSS